MRNKHLVGFLFACALAFFAPREASAATCVVSHTFVTGETLTATNMNANPANEVNCINNVDFNNIGVAGIYASQIKPGNTTQATFGGSSVYTFPVGVNAGGPLTATTGVFSGTVSANSIVPQPVATPNSSSTIIGFGDSTTWGAYGPTSCVSAQNAPSSVASGSLTGNCWLDKIGAYYGAHVIDLGWGGTELLTDVGQPGSAGIHRYNNSATCPAQGSSPTSGLNNNCNPGTVPALDSLVGPNTWVYFAYNGINDGGDNPNVSNYQAFLSAVQTIVNDLVVHGQPINQIVGVGAPMGNTSQGSFFNGYSLFYLPYTGALAYVAMSDGFPFVDLWNYVATQPRTPGPNSYYYDSTHFNNSGHALEAQALEATPGSTTLQSMQAAVYAGAYTIVGSIYNALKSPMFANGSGALNLPFGSYLQVGNTTINNGGQYYNSSLMYGTDNTNALIRPAISTGGVFFQNPTGPANLGHIDVNGFHTDTGMANQCYTAGATTLCQSALNVSGTGAFSGAVTGASYTGGPVGGTTGTFSGALKTQSSYVAPTYNESGTVLATATTWHETLYHAAGITANGSCGVNNLCAGTPQSVTFTGAGAFASAPTSCQIAGTTLGGWTVTWSGNTVTFQLQNLQTGTISNGASLGDVYIMCKGN